jgi:molybdopterin converting factor small subunit
MFVRVKLMASLRSKLPAGSQGGTAALEVEPGTTVAGALDQLGISGGHVHLVMINGAMETDRQRPLVDGDELVVFPPVAGG